MDQPPLTTIVVRTRTRRSRRSRSRRYYSVSASLPRNTQNQRLDALILTLLIMVLCLLVIRQPGLAQVLPLPVNQPASWGSGLISALGQAFQFAQAFEPLTITQQGNQIVLNGRSYPAAWSRRQDQIGLTDAALLQLVGVDLLNTNDATQQPVEWFSDQRSAAISLSTWRSEQYRYLDVSYFTQQCGWQLEAKGETLQISTPTAKVTRVRQGRQEWGDRIVVDLDRSAPWQIEEQAESLAITIDAAIDSALVRSFRAGVATYLNALKVEANGNRTVIRIGFAAGMRPRIWAIPNPDRLLIDVRRDFLVERDILWAPGVRWQQRFVNLGSSRFPVVSLEVNPRQPGVSIKPIVSNTTTAVGTAPLVTTAQKDQVAAAINGGFFNRNNQLPLGAIRRDHQWLSGPILNRGAIAWNDTGDVNVGHLKLQEILKTSNGNHLPVVYLNSGYVGVGIYRHTQEWGTHYTPILDNEKVVTVRNDRITQQQQAGAAGQTSIAIPTDGYLLVVRGNDAAFNALTVGTTVELEAATQPTEFDQYPQIIGAGPLLVKNRQIVLNAQAEQFSEAFRQQSAPRSVIATTVAGNLVLVAVHNRIGGSGPTLTEMAQLMQQMGMVNALNLDGGSSTALYLGGRLLDRVPNTAARVHNGIGVFIQPGS